MDLEFKDLGTHLSKNKKKCNCSFVNGVQNVKPVIFPETRDFSGSEKG